MGLIFKKSTAQPNFEVGAAIIGTAQVGQSLECTYTVTKARAENQRVEWWRHAEPGTVGVQVGTGSNYVLTGNDVGFYLRAIAVASNPAGSASSTSSFTSEVLNPDTPPDAPSVATPASISGTQEVGGTLTASWEFAGETSEIIEWRRYSSSGATSGAWIGNANSIQLTVLDQDQWIGFKAIGTNSAGDTETSARVGPIAAASSSEPQWEQLATIALDDGAVGYNEGEYIICDCEVSGNTTAPTFTWYKCDAGKTNAEELVGAGVATIQPLFKSEPNKYRVALFLNQSLGLNSGGKYVYCVATAVNGAAPGGVTSESAAVGPIGAIQGTPISQTTVGSGEDPYLIQSSGTYYLTEDIEFKQTGFALLASDITLNLNGKTVTWGDEAIIGPTNPSFELGEASWDFTGSGNTAAGAGDSGGGEYLLVQSFASTTAETDEQYCFNKGLAHDGVSALWWTSAAAGDAGVFHYAESAEFTCPAPGKWYSVSFRFRMVSSAAAAFTYPRIELRKDGATVATWTLTANSTMAKGPTSGELVFKADDTSPTYTIRVGVMGVATKTSAGWFDDFRICRARAVGVAVGQTYSGTISWESVYSGVTYNNTTSNRNGYHFAPPPDIAVGGGGSNIRVKNGSLVQGAGECFMGQSLRASSTFYANRITSSVNGPSASGASTSQQGGYADIRDCVMTCSGITCAHREAWYGAAIYKLYGVVARCTLTGQPSSGIACVSAWTAAPLTAYGNTIRGKVRATNGFGIMMRGSGDVADVHDNVIDQTGDYFGRGLILDGGYGGNVYNNYIAIRQADWNSDTGSGYSPYVVDGDYCLQIEGPSATPIEIYGNELVAVSQGPVLNKSPRTCAVRPKGVYSSANVKIYGNTITCIASDSGISHAYSTKQIYGTGLQIYDNTVTTNSGLLYSTQDLVTTYVRDTINYESTLVRGWPVVVPFTSESQNIAVRFLDCSYDAEAQSLIFTESPRADSGALTGTSLVNKASYKIAWTVTIATGAPGASVSVADQTAAVIASGAADAQGRFVCELPQTTHTVPANNTKLITTHSPYTVTATLDALSGSAQFTADATKTINVSMS